ncbi:MAG: hypothetical protein Q9202_004789 [Teloschistes flavicans]
MAPTTRSTTASKRKLPSTVCMDEPKTIWDFLNLYTGVAIPKPGSMKRGDLPPIELGFEGRFRDKLTLKGLQLEPDKDAKTIMDNLMQSLVILHNHAESQPGQSGDRLKLIYREYINFVLSEKTWQCIYQNYRFSLDYHALFADPEKLINALKEAKAIREARGRLPKGSKNSGAAKKGKKAVTFKSNTESDKGIRKSARLKAKGKL